MMIRGRLLHLLIVVALLCSQVVSAAHMASHVHGPAHSHSQDHDCDDHLLSIESGKSIGQDGSDTSHELALSCAIYHIHAGAHFLPQNPALVAVAAPVDTHQLPSLTPEWHAPVRGLHSIRGPPGFS